MSWIKSIKLVKLNEVVLLNECSPTSSVVKCGRSNEFNQSNQTNQIQGSYYSERISSCSECG